MKRTIETSHQVGPLSFRALVQHDSIDEAKRTVDLVWTTAGSRQLRGGFFQEPFFEELSLDPKHVRMGRLQSGAPFMDTHNEHGTGNTDGVIGVVESARLEGERGVATVRFAKAEDDPKAETVFRKVKDKILRNISVGFRTHKLEQIEAAKNGQPAVFRATDWEPFELSVVPMGEDAGAQFRSADAQAKNACVVIHHTQERETMDPIQTATGTSGAAATGAAATGTGGGERAAISDADAARLQTAGATAERARAADIRRTGKAIKLPGEFVERHVEAGTAADEFRRLAIEEAAKIEPVVRDGGPIVVTVDARDKMLRGAGDWLIERAAVGPMVIAAAKAKGETLKLDGGEFRGLSFVELARKFLEARGQRTAGVDKMTLLGRAMTFREGMNSTSDFSVLLENVMNKTLLAAYAIAPDKWRRFCKAGTVSDFRPHPRYRMGTFGRLAVVNEHGEFRNQNIPDGEKESITATTKGNIVAITRQALINDDMGVFNSIGPGVGRAAALSVERDVFDALAENGGLGPNMEDGKPLFDADHANIGSGSVLSIAGIDADRQVMARQMDPSSNEFIELIPTILLVALTEEGKAKQINNDEFDPDSSNGVGSNIVRGVFSDIVASPRLTGPRRYLFADPNTAPALEVAFLDGNQTPFLESREGWRIDGVEWKVRLDYGVGGVDFRAAGTNPGEPDES